MLKMRILLISLLAGLLAACTNVPIAEDVSQTEANQIIAVLARHGIYAVSYKDDTGKPKYSVEVDSSFYTQAKTILVEKSLPRGDKASFTEIVEAKGLLPNSREIEALRVDHAMAVELEEALNMHPGVSNAKVIIRSHEDESGSRRAVSVILTKKAAAELSQQEIQAIVEKTVPGSTAENTVLSISPENHQQEGEVLLNERGVLMEGGKEVYLPLTHFIFNWKIPDADYNEMVVVLIICLFVIGILGGLIGYWYGYFKNSRIVLENSLPELNVKTLRLDRGERTPPGEI